MFLESYKIEQIEMNLMQIKKMPYRGRLPYITLYMVENFQNFEETLYMLDGSFAALMGGELQW